MIPLTLLSQRLIKEVEGQVHSVRLLDHGHQVRQESSQLTDTVRVLASESVLQKVSELIQKVQMNSWRYVTDDRMDRLWMDNWHAKVIQIKRPPFPFSLQMPLRPESWIEWQMGSHAKRDFQPSFHSTCTRRTVFFFFFMDFPSLGMELKGEVLLFDDQNLSLSSSSYE